MGRWVGSPPVPTPLLREVFERVPRSRGTCPSPQFTELSRFISVLFFVRVQLFSFSWCFTSLGAFVKSFANVNRVPPADWGPPRKRPRRPRQLVRSRGSSSPVWVELQTPPGGLV